jgi:hypothetical protein
MNEVSHFQSFWMGGYECSDKLNAFGHRVDILDATRHVDLIEEDYKALRALNISTVREGIRWSLVERTPYVYDWSIVRKMIAAGKQTGVQQIWDLCHFGYPDDLTPLHPLFARRFSSLCSAFINFYRSVDPDGLLILTPINEVNFLAWLGGEVRGTSPYCINLGFEVKYALMRAYIEGVTTIKKADPRVLILATEPLVNIVPPHNATAEEIAAAERADEDQFQSLDMLTGRICPELGGCENYLDIIGCNFYYSNQWEWRSNENIPWANIPYDSRWKPLSEIFKKVFYRYNKECILAETSHPGEHRPEWINYIAEECAVLVKGGFPLTGICIYPVTDRPDWDDLSFWHKSGIWDSEITDDGLQNNRVLNIPYAAAIAKAQQLIASAIQTRESRTTPYFSVLS